MEHPSPVASLRHAIPYLRHHRGQTFVVKCGGEGLRTQEEALRVLEQLQVLHDLGVRVVFVHGGGTQANELAKRLGVEYTFVEGRRATSREMLQVSILALNGEVQATLLGACRKLGVDAVGLSGIDSGLIQAEPRSKVPIDFGHVGEIVGIDTKVLESLLDRGHLPIVSPLAADANGEPLNINADTVAAAIAVAIGASKLIMLTGAEGILETFGDPTTLISQLALTELEALIESGKLSGGMLPKSSAIHSALKGGVDRVHVIGFGYPDSILTELFTNEGCGTLISLTECDLL
ncbi:MAG: acetylglutamate kinase [Chthonomonas sp.]|nr:acetylglutamate kinase [Chthonomonas sp.]